MHAFSKRPSTRHPISSCHLRAILSLSIVRVRRKKIFRAAYKFLNFCRALLTVNISEMADKEKRLRKILSRRGWKGRLKSVATLEKAHIIIIEDGQSMTKTQLIDKDSYVMALENGYTFPEDRVHYLVPSNPRDVRQVAWGASSSSGNMRHLRQI